MANWFVQRDGSEQGPFTFQKLKIRAATGTLRPDDLVRQDRGQSWVPALSVKGLFSGTEAIAETQPVRQSIKKDGRESKEFVARNPNQRAASTGTFIHDSVQEKPSQKWSDHQIVRRIKAIVWSSLTLAVATTCCFPIGLSLIWTHPTWSMLRKSFWTGIFFLCLTLLAVAHFRSVHWNKQEFLAADALWNSGNESAAIEKYRNISTTYFTDKEKETVYGRLIEWDADHGNDGSAIRLIWGMKSRKLSPRITSRRANELIAKFEAEERAKQDKAEEKGRLEREEYVRKKTKRETEAMIDDQLRQKRITPQEAKWMKDNLEY